MNKKDSLNIKNIKTPYNEDIHTKNNKINNNQTINQSIENQNVSNEKQNEDKSLELKNLLSKHILMKIENNKIKEENKLLKEKETYYVKKIVEKDSKPT